MCGPLKKLIDNFGPIETFSLTCLMVNKMHVLKKICYCI